MKPSSLRSPLLCLCLLVLAGCGKSTGNGPPQMPPPEVGVVTVQPQNSPLTRDLVGRLSAYRSADVRARVAGVLLKRDYEEGTDVTRGQLLFQIDPAPLQAELNAAKASLAQAQASWTNNKVTAQRVRELAPKGYVSKADLDNALAAERSSAAAVQAARANVETARINLGYANVTAPIAGRAGQQQVTEGALVGSGAATLLTTVEQIDPLYVNFTLSVESLENMRQAQSEGNVTLAGQNKASVRITLPDGSTYAEPGTVDFSAATVNPATGSVDLRATIPNPKHKLLPGMYVTLQANLGQRHKVFVLPQQAVQRDTTGAYVMTVGADNKVVRKDVTTADMRDGDWVISGGLKAGDKVVVSGIQNVKEGEPAKPSPWHRDAPAGATSTAPAGGASANGQ
ncbi:MAG: efflux RND transporter periplasmic adaptor subunit [Rhodanobacter sp.]|jgi:membrane fusion protein (multidrug efflux system)|uniref:Efflux RND transporter periplasmic adaptor subunit n=2 Tax=unclassified Rhodanobacter TaxID=2621553 RepID=A0AB74UV23_9GAMM|nr:efflux RND transporter periplasmic adaptor subunit [Rhodanobacter sp.]MBN8947583.1 efflux RND transporter periplasmic adaptor subunit [Rhodanobacter sp.]ODT96911.1 MAG: efflux transporter periplasmic adaptor subunit [Rhodanobacter sp. SCN 67-45]OJW40928.1 MAG: efflux transporter periplasmic adaptor subunit [Rhodanobacter sp. 67-28]